MEDLEKNLSSLPKYKLSKKADFKIKSKIYAFVFSKNLQKFAQAFFHPHSLVAKVSLVALMIFVVLSGTAVYAVSNDHITPGSTLYPLKKTIENVEQKLSFTETAKVETLNKLSERRLKEALNMAEEEDDRQSDDQKEEFKYNIEQSIEEAVNNFDSAIETSKKIENTVNSKTSKENLKNRQESMVKYLDSINDIAKNKKDESMIKKIDEAKRAIEEHDFDDEDRIKSTPKNNKENSKKNSIKNKEHNGSGGNQLNSEKSESGPNDSSQSRHDSEQDTNERD